MESKLLLPQSSIAPIRSLEEARAFYKRLNTPIKVEKTDRKAPFEWHMGSASLGAITLSTNWYRSGVRAWTGSSGDLITVSLPVGPVGGEITHGNTTVSLRQGHTGYLSSPLLPVDARLGSGFQSIKLSIQRSVAESALAAIGGVNVSAPLRFEPALSLHAGAGAVLSRLVIFMVGELAQDERIIASPFLAPHFSDAILGCLLQGQPHNYAGLIQTPSRPAEPKYVRQAAEYLEANAAEPISLTALAGVTGVSVRALHAGFQRYRKCTPLEFLRERRLLLARTKLLTSPHLTITEVALLCGFGHLGRFSGLYRARFGETPSQARLALGSLPG